MKHFVHIVLLFLCPLTSLAQYYMKGQVMDEAGNPLQNARIFLHSNGYIYYSGSEGSFGIVTNTRNDTLTITMEGYYRQKLLVDAGGFVEIKLKKAPVVRTRPNKLASLTQNLKRETQQLWFTGDETYASMIENHFVNATAYPVTGMSMTVDRASYSNIRRFLTMNTMVPPDAVRMEELLNYFNFDYTEPAHGKTFEIRPVLTECPWNRNAQLLFANLSSKKLNLDSLPQTHLVFLIDVSGSMDMPNRLPLLKAGFKSLVNNMRPQDSVSIVVYGGVVGVILPTTGGDEKGKIRQIIDSLQPGGSTPGESGIKLAYSVARNHFIKGGNNRIILATDGDFNVGLKTEEELDEMITSQRERGIYLTCIGVGMGNYKDSKIQTLAQRGNGNFAYIDNYSEAEKVLITEYTQTVYSVADDAYLNVRFDPDYIKEYRLIGFDNKVGSIRDQDAVVEGGVIGSAYSTLIAFEIIPTQRGQEMAKNKQIFQPVNFHLRYRLPNTNQYYQLIDSAEIAFTPLKDLPSYYRLASSLIMFGSVLRKSKFVKEVSWNDIFELASASADPENYSQREFVYLVHQARTIYTKRKRKDKKEPDE